MMFSICWYRFHTIPLRIRHLVPSRSAPIAVPTPPPHISYRVVPDHRLRSFRPACRAAGRGAGRVSRSNSSDAVPAMRCQSTGRTRATGRTERFPLICSTPFRLSRRLSGKLGRGVLYRPAFRSAPRHEERGVFLPPIPICNLCVLPSVSHAISTLPNI